MEQKKNNMAMASMILGILSIVLSCCCFMGFMLGAMAILFARLSKVDFRMEGKATAGMVTGIIGMVLGVVSMILWITLTAGDGDLTKGFSYIGYLPAVQTLVRGGLL